MLKTTFAHAIFVSKSSARQIALDRRQPCQQHAATVKFAAAWRRHRRTRRPGGKTEVRTFRCPVTPVLRQSTMEGGPAHLCLRTSQPPLGPCFRVIQCAVKHPLSPEQ